MRTSQLGWWMSAICVACGGDPATANTASATADDAAATDHVVDSSSDHGGADEAADDSGSATDDPLEESGAGFDLGSADSRGGGDDQPPGSCTMRECVDTSATAMVSLTPCDDWFGTFFPPYDAHYECWMGGLVGSMFGDSGAAFAPYDPDLLLVGTWQGDMAQIRVTRDASCNITGFASATWQPFDAPEPGEVDVRAMTWLDDGTMLLSRTAAAEGSPSSAQIGVRGPGATTTTAVVELTDLLPGWPDTLTYGNPVVSLVVVPAGFPGAGSVKMIAEKPDSAHWHSLTLAADGSGTYDITAAIEETTLYPPEADWGGYYYRGTAFVAPENPDVDVPSVLVTEAWHYIVALYELDDDGNPLPETRTPFIEGLGMPSGAALDPVSGNNFTFTGRRSGDLYVIRGCEASGSNPRG